LLAATSNAFPSGQDYPEALRRRRKERCIEFQICGLIESIEDQDELPGTWYWSSQEVDKKIAQLTIR
jgi:hypothetical protein